MYGFTCKFIHVVTSCSNTVLYSRHGELIGQGLFLSRRRKRSCRTLVEDSLKGSSNRRAFRHSTAHHAVSRLTKNHVVTNTTHPTLYPPAIPPRPPPNTSPYLCAACTSSKTLARPRGFPQISTKNVCRWIGLWHTKCGHRKAYPRTYTTEGERALTLVYRPSPATRVST
jgi:hypothetical protein